MRFGATVGRDTTKFSIWAPSAGSVSLLIGDGEDLSEHPLRRGAEGWYETAVACALGTHYRYRIDDEIDVPDPASRFNPDGVHGPSEVLDPSAFEWRDEHWQGRPWHEAVVYELHVGTFTPEGTFRAVVPRLRDLKELGVTGIELMPLAAFAGQRGWGYDGVLPFAPHAAYGTPEDLKHLVQSAHDIGLMVILDVVYNHFGPEGNYLPRYAAPLFTDRRHTPWGQAIDFASAWPRQFFIDNALYWLEEYHCDGLRLDAVHEIFDASETHFVDGLAQQMAAGPGRHRHVHLVVENYANQSSRLAPLKGVSKAQWNDDFHHALHVLLTGEHDGYYGNYQRTPLRHLGRALAEGFAYQGEPFTTSVTEPRGEDSTHLPPTAFIDFLQNHDQIGNRARGERLIQLTTPAQLRCAMALTLLSPSIPMLFMGEEYGATQPFLYFCDYHGELGAAVCAGRRAEFAGFRNFTDLAIPDPNDAATFQRSRLDWQDRLRPPHEQWLAFVTRLLAVRHRHVVPRIPAIQPGGGYELHGKLLSVRWPAASEQLVLVANLGDQPIGAGDVAGEVLFAIGADAGTDALQPWDLRLLLQRL